MAALRAEVIALRAVGDKTAELEKVREAKALVANIAAEREPIVSAGPSSPGSIESEIASLKAEAKALAQAQAAELTEESPTLDSWNLEAGVTVQEFRFASQSDNEFILTDSVSQISF